MSAHPPLGPGTRAAVDFGRVRVFLGEKNGKYPDGNQIVVAGSDTRVAIDTSRSSHLIGPDLASADLVLLSHGHEDHMAGLYLLPGVPLQVHAADLPAVQSWPAMADACGFAPAIRAQMHAMFTRDFAYAPRPDATGFADGAVWDLGGVRIRAVHTPGHTAGHSALVVEDEGLAFIGDIDLSGFGPYYGDARSSLTDFRRSIALVREIPARIWVTGHHKGIYSDRAAFLADLAAYEARIDARDQRLLARLREGPATLADLVRHRLLYPPGFDAIWLEAVEARVITRHLELLRAQGQVVFDPAGGVYELA